MREYITIWLNPSAALRATALLPLACGNRHLRQGKKYLENYDILRRNDCFKRKKTPQNTIQVSSRLCSSFFRPIRSTELVALAANDCPRRWNIKVIQITFYVSISYIVLFFTPLPSIQFECHLFLTWNSSFVKIVN